MPVHGEFERNDMVKYFGEQLDGFAFTRHGWVQSYGSRCVAPPIIWADVSRPAPMTVRWSAYAQSLTDAADEGHAHRPGDHAAVVLRPRPTSARETVCRQIALAIRDEVLDLEAAGHRRSSRSTSRPSARACRCGRPTAPTTCAGRSPASAWRPPACATTRRSTPTCATRNSTTSSAHRRDGCGRDLDRDGAQRHGAARGLRGDFDYPNEIGPGVWDIHSPRVPSAEEMAGLLRRAAWRVPTARLWLNPDCGCKTRGWAEVKPAVENLVAGGADPARRIGLTRPWVGGDSPAHPGRHQPSRSR